MPLTQLTDIPQSTDELNFSPRADNLLGFQLPRMIDEINALNISAANTQSDITYASILFIDCSVASTFDITLTGNISIGLITPSANGQKIVLRLRQDSIGSRLVTFDSSIKFGTDITSFIATTTPNKTDVIGLIYNAQDNKFSLVAVAKGY